MTTPSTWEERFDSEFCMVGEKLEHLYVRDWHLPADLQDVKDFISSVVIPEVLRTIVPEERGTQEQEEATKCGLYHWNDCVAEIKRRILDI